MSDTTFSCPKIEGDSKPIAQLNHMIKRFFLLYFPTLEVVSSIEKMEYVNFDQESEWYYLIIRTACIDFKLSFDRLVAGRNIIDILADVQNDTFENKKKLYQNLRVMIMKMETVAERYKKAKKKKVSFPTEVIFPE